MDNARDGGMGVVADRIRVFFRQRCQFARIGDELAGNGIVGIVGVDEGGERRRDGDGQRFGRRAGRGDSAVPDQSRVL